MKKLLLVSAAVCVVGHGGAFTRCRSADQRSQDHRAGPLSPGPAAMLGAHAGGGWASTDVTDPVQLVQDSFSGVSGDNQASPPPTSARAGLVVGGQIGCDYQFAPSWVVGIEGAASGSTMKGSTSVGLPVG